MLQPYPKRFLNSNVYSNLWICQYPGGYYQDFDEMTAELGVEVDYSTIDVLWYIGFVSVAAKKTRDVPLRNCARRTLSD